MMSFNSTIRGELQTGPFARDMTNPSRGLSRLSRVLQIMARRDIGHVTRDVTYVTSQHTQFLCSEEAGAYENKWVLPRVAPSGGARSAAYASRKIK